MSFDFCFDTVLEIDFSLQSDAIAETPVLFGRILPVNADGTVSTDKIVMKARDRAMMARFHQQFKV